MPPKMRDIQPPRFAFEPIEVVFRDAGGEVLDKAARRAMLREVRQGEPHQLTLDVVAFRQSSTARPLLKAQRGEANANFSMFDPEKLEQLARSFKGSPFLRDHDRSQAAMGGRIVGAEAKVDGNWTEFSMSILLQAQWAVEAALEGTMQTFSIGADFKARTWREIFASILCTVCDGPYFSSECGHIRGQEVKHDATGQTHIVEVLFRNMRGAELSATPFPAVQGTGIDDMRAALSEAYNMDEIAKLLGLEADSSKDDIAAAISSLMDAATEPSKPAPADDAGDEGLAAVRKELEEARSELAAEKELHAEAKKDLEAARASLAEHDQAAEDALVERALAEGRMRPGNKATEAEIRRRFKDGRELAEEYVANLQKLDPLGRELDADPEGGKKTAGNEFGLTRRQLDYCEQMGVEPETYRKMLDEEQETAA